MDTDIFATLQQKISGFSKGQKRIAAFITESYDQAAFMTASVLGKTVGVSESTVVRFAVELGYDGYPSMQKALQEMVVNRLTSVQRMGVTHSRIGDQNVVSMVLHSDADKLRKTAETIDENAFRSAMDAILKAKRIFILGARSASALAGFLGYYLSYMFDNVHIVTTSGCSEMLEKLVSVNSGDVAIAFSFPRYSAATVKGAMYCHSVGATVVGVTNSHLSPLCEHCDHTLLAKSDMLSVVDSLVAPLSLVNAMIVDLASARQDVLESNFSTLERVWEEYNVYEKRANEL